jgi:biotin carboxyl carrier protein
MPGNRKAWNVKVNGFDFSFDDAALAAASIIQHSPTQFNLLINNRSVNVTLLQEPVCKKAVVEIDGEVFETTIKDELDQMLDAMGFSAAATKQIKEIKAPMPGLVLEIAVEEGQKVKEGDKLLTLGAMKMENSITIPADAVIKRIPVKAGQAVDKGQVLIELE